jgi:hypothetical protein
MHLRFDAIGSCIVNPNDQLKLSIWTLKAPALALMVVPHKAIANLASATSIDDKHSIMSFIQGAPLAANEVPSIERYEAIAKFWNIPSMFFLFLLVASVALIIAPLAFIGGSPGNMAHPLLVASVFAGVCTYYALISPPLQGPDEATHFNSYLAHTGQSQKIPELKTWAARIHYPRINCQIGSCLSSEDLHIPTEIPLPRYVYTLDINTRSAIGGTGLGIFGDVFSSLPIEHQLLGLRFFNVACGSFLICLSLLIFFPRSTLTSAQSFNFIGTWVAVPTLGFLSMNANNHGLTINGYACLLMGCLSAFVNKNPHSARQFAWAGALCALVVFSGRTGIAGGAILISAYYAVASIRCRDTFQWMAGTVAMSLMILLIYWLYKDSPYTIQQLSGMKQRLESIAGQVVSSNFIFYLVLLLFGFSTLFILRVISTSTALKHLIHSSEKTIRVVSRLLALITVVAFGFLGSWPLIHEPFAIPDIEYRSHGLTRLRFVQSVVRSFWLNFGVQGQDFFIHSSLWAGFGCPDRALPNLFLQFLKLAILLGLGAGFVKALWNLDGREITIRVFGISLMTIWMLVVSIMLLPVDFGGGVNPHGRFLIGSAMICGYLAVSGSNLLFPRDFSGTKGFA